MTISMHSLKCQMFNSFLSEFPFGVLSSHFICLMFHPSCKEHKSLELAKAGKEETGQDEARWEGLVNGRTSGKQASLA